MEPVFNRRGVTVAWAVQDCIVDGSGKHVAMIHNGAVFDYSGSYLGSFDKGYFRDQDGYAVAFVRSAAGGPSAPVPPDTPDAPLPDVPPMPPLLPKPPAPPVGVLAWSDLDWDAFLHP